MAKIQHIFGRAFKSDSKFGLLEFDNQGFLISPELDDEQKAELLTVNGFSKVLEEGEEESALNEQQDSLEGVELPDELKDLKNVPQLRKFAKEHDIELQGSKKDEILSEILEALNK